MDYVTLSNGDPMPMVGFGVFQITDAKQCEKAVLDALDAGYRHIDTAQAYGNEEAVGNAIAASGIDKEEVFVTTKVWVSNAGYENALRSIEESRKKLKKPYIDMVLIHQPFGDYYGTYRAMEELYRMGRVKAIGVSNFSPDRLVDLAINADIPPMVDQVDTRLQPADGGQEVDGQIRLPHRVVGTFRGRQEQLVLQPRPHRHRREVR